MITNNDVLKAIVDHKKTNGQTDYRDVMENLNIDDLSLLPFLRELNASGYITYTMESVAVTSLGMIAYNDMKPAKIIKKSVYNFSKFTLQRIIDIFIGIVIGVAVACIASHFGWQ